ncbi:hypothetical protein BJ741DRAFT_712634 [Chytriomyces cf. hyalinus JEL632]|nr:hypothetical protein BJ741DRAFT_712634 [Chytriomyces cf. hyalinus JEL632]
MPDNATAGVYIGFAAAIVLVSLGGISVALWRRHKNGGHFVMEPAVEDSVEVEFNQRMAAIDKKVADKRRQRSLQSGTNEADESGAAATAVSASKEVA